MLNNLVEKYVNKSELILGKRTVMMVKICNEDTDIYLQSDGEFNTLRHRMSKGERIKFKCSKGELKSIQLLDGKLVIKKHGGTVEKVIN